MGNNRKSAETKEQIFQACRKILTEEGLSNLTLQAVADQAGLSKGGLLYHFPSKEDLVEALFEYHNGIFEERLQELFEQEADQSGAFIRAYAKASAEQMADPENASLYASLFAAEEKYASAHKLMRQKYKVWQNKINQCDMDTDWAMMLRFAADGLWFIEMHQYAPPSPDQRERIVDIIVRLAQYKENPIS